MYAVTTWMVQTLTGILVGTNMNKLQKQNKQQLKKLSKAFISKTNMNTQERRLEVAKFMLARIERNRKNGTPHPNDERDRIKYQTVLDGPTPVYSFRRTRAFNCFAKVKDPTAKLNNEWKYVLSDKLCLALADDIDGVIKPVHKDHWPFLEAQINNVTAETIFPPNKPVPSFEGGAVYRGFLLIKCKNRFSKSHIIECMLKLRNAIKGKSLCLLRARQIDMILKNHSAIAIPKARPQQPTSPNTAHLAPQNQGFQLSVNYFETDIEGGGDCVPQESLKEKYDKSQRYIQQLSGVTKLDARQKRKKREALAIVEKYENSSRRLRTGEETDFDLKEDLSGGEYFDSDTSLNKHRQPNSVLNTTRKVESTWPAFSSSAEINQTKGFPGNVSSYSNSSERVFERRKSPSEEETSTDFNQPDRNQFDQQNNNQQERIKNYSNSIELFERGRKSPRDFNHFFPSDRHTFDQQNNRQERITNYSNSSERLFERRTSPSEEKSSTDFNHFSQPDRHQFDQKNNNRQKRIKNYSEEKTSDFNHFFQRERRPNDGPTSINYSPTSVQQHSSSFANIKHIDHTELPSTSKGISNNQTSSAWLCNSSNNTSRNASHYNADLQVVVVDCNQHDGRIPYEVWLNIEKALLEELNREMLETNNTNIGMFGGLSYQAGFKVIQCDTMEAYNFLKRCLHNQNFIWPNARYDVVMANDLPGRSLIQIWMKDPKLEDMDVLQILKAQNPLSLSTDWILVKSHFRKNGNGKDFQLSVPMESLERLKERDGQEYRKEKLLSRLHACVK